MENNFKKYTSVPSNTPRENRPSDCFIDDGTYFAIFDDGQAGLFRFSHILGAKRLVGNKKNNKWEERTVYKRKKLIKKWDTVEILFPPIDNYAPSAITFHAGS